MAKYVNKQKIIYFIVTLLFFWNILSNNILVAKEDRVPQKRPIQWAVATPFSGLPNFFKVSEELYRGGQPEERGIVELQKLGIKTIVNLRTSNHDEAWVKGTGLQYFHLPTTAEFPSKKKFKRFLAIMANPANYPVFVHCKHGSDRTGVAVALFRIKIQKWTAADAIFEMVNGGYGFHKIYSHLKKFVRQF